MGFYNTGAGKKFVGRGEHQGQRAQHGAGRPQRRPAQQPGRFLGRGG
ncbi:hypothetical protein [Hymenobacter weizhouensis]|nr:hypothetical protein [Hymenobacter sp. YIM 151500-1]UYZ61998.1 hypothetical protein OIS53_13410 [Hymenobacter sp. YIM 151500-1]